MDPATCVYNEHFARDGLALVRGWQRMQGIVTGRATRASSANPRRKP